MTSRITTDDSRQYRSFSFFGAALLLALVLAASGLARQRGQSGTDVPERPSPWHGCALTPGTLQAWVAARDSGFRVAAYCSPDFGRRWQEKPLPTNHRIFDVFFLDSLNGWTCGQVAEVLRTTDGGTNWEWTGFGTSFNALRVQFLDPAHGWIACDWAMMGRWSDSLQSWYQIILPYPEFSEDSTDFRGISFVDSSHGWMCAGIYSETDTMPGGQGYIAHTADGCSTWTRQVRDTINDYYGIKFVDLNTGVVVGGSDRTQQGYIARTTDGGQTWTEQTIPPTTAFLRNVAFPDARHGWAVGQLGTIVHSSDGGQTWSMQASGTDSILYDVDFTDSLHGLVSGGQVVLFTSDGGNTWTLSPVAVTEEKTQPSRPAAALSLSATPSLFCRNTTLSYALPGDPKLARLEIRDVTGRLVRTESPLTPTLSPKGRGREGCFAWDGTDNDGQRLISGCYFCTLRAGTQVAQTKVLLTR